VRDPPTRVDEGPDLGELSAKGWPRGTAGPIPTRMNPDFTVIAVPSRPAPPLKTLLLAIVAPFVAIGLMATPLLFTAARQTLGF
jgi:hypothetical protein